jgi:hypothetical protein
MLHLVLGKQRRRSSPLLGVLGAAWLGVAGCNGNIIDPPSDGTPAPGGNSPGAGGNNGGSSQGGSSSPGAPFDPATAAAPPATTAIPVCTSDEAAGPRRLRLLTRAEYSNTVVDLLGISAPSIDNLPVETVVDGFDNNARAAAVTSRHIDEYLSTAERVAVQSVMQSRDMLSPCGVSSGCDRQFITNFGRRAFRRPLSNEEVDRYAKLFDAAVTGGAFDKGMELVIRTMLSSPNFLYRSEMGEKAADGSYRLTPYEAATALSYFLWGSTPDDQLLDAAAAGTLTQGAGLETEVKRLLADQRSRPAIAAFFRQWLGTDGLRFTNKDAAIFPNFGDPIRKAMLDEEDAFINYVIFEGTGKYPELFTANYVFTNAALAQFYGLDAAGAGGDEMTRTPVPATGATRGGLLTLGAVLGMHAHSNETSPIRRGLFVRARLLCQSMPPPPPNVDTTPPGLDPSLTTRARFNRHSTDPACQGCHTLLDPVGYGFERYDGAGAYRAQEAGMDVDASGEIRGLEDLNAQTSAKFNGPLELGRLIAGSPNAQACLARQIFRFERGGENGTADACAISKLQAAFRDSGFDLQRLLLEVVRGKSFLTRN